MHSVNLEVFLSVFCPTSRLKCDMTINMTVDTHIGELTLHQAPP